MEKKTKNACLFLSEVNVEMYKYMPDVSTVLPKGSADARIKNNS